MQQTSFDHLRKVLLPSVFSFTLCLIVTSLIIVAAILAFNAQNGFLFEYLLGPDSSAQVLLSTRNTVSAITNAFLSNNFLNSIVWYLMWAGVGLCVYVFLVLSVNLLTSTKASVDRIAYSHSSKSSLVLYYGMRLAVSSLVAITFVLYIILLVKVLIPVSVLAARTGFAGLSNSTGWLYAAYGGVVLFCSLHTIAILLRLLLLRQRVFDSSSN